MCGIELFFWSIVFSLLTMVVEDREHLFADSLGDGIQTGAGAASENYTFHELLIYRLIVIEEHITLSIAVAVLIAGRLIDQRSRETKEYSGLSIFIIKVKV